MDRPKPSRKAARNPSKERLRLLNERIGANIRKYRKAKGFTQERLAEATELSTFFIGSVERGQATISLRSLEQLAEVLGVPMSDLVTQVDEIELASLQRRAAELIKRCDGESLRLLVALLQRCSES